MKISEMNNNQACEAMIQLTDGFSGICEDAEMMNLFNGLEGKTWVEALKGVIPKFVALALSKHKDDLYKMVAALNCVPIASVGEMNFFETVKSIKDSIDEVFVSFFTSSVKATVKGEEGQS